MVPPYDVFDIEFHTEKGKYWGFSPMLSYNYFIWKERLLFGVQVKMRKYFGYQRIQYEWGIHFGYIF